MIVDLTDQTVSRVIREKGLWQSDIMHLLALFVEPGMKVLNVGPQTGLEAIMIGRLIGEKGSLYLVEPNSPSFAILKKNVYLNGLEETSFLYRVGAADVQAKYKIEVSS